MQRYADTLTALNTAMNLMIEEDDSLLIAAISHPLHMVESQLMLRRASVRQYEAEHRSLNERISDSDSDSSSSALK
jgi:hypothetical protein